MSDNPNSVDPARTIGMLILAVIAFILVAGCIASVLWFVARQVDMLSLTWRESLLIGLGYVVIRIVDRMAWPASKS